MKLFNLQRHNPDADHETGAHCCYHCGKAKHQDGSVFCPECFPEPGSLPALIDERPKQEPRRRVAELFALFLRPVRHANNIRLRLLACQDDKRDLEQANLALRRKCADLRAQRDSALGMLDEALTDKAALQKLLAEAERDRNDLARGLIAIEIRKIAPDTQSTEPPAPWVADINRIASK